MRENGERCGAHKAGVKPDIDGADQCWDIRWALVEAMQYRALATFAMGNVLGDETRSVSHHAAVTRRTEKKRARKIVLPPWRLKKRSDQGSTPWLSRCSGPNQVSTFRPAVRPIQYPVLSPTI